MWKLKYLGPRFHFVDHRADDKHEYFPGSSHLVDDETKVRLTDNTHSLVEDSWEAEPVDGHSAEDYIQEPDVKPDVAMPLSAPPELQH